MLKPAKQPPKSPSPTKNKREPRHWNERVHECILSAGPEGLCPMVIKGGAENGQFCYIGEIKQDQMNYHSGKLHHDEILLEIQGQKVSGFTLRDMLEWLKHVSKNSAPVMFKTIKAALLTKDLRQYLNQRFQKSSVDHDLQQTIRDNLYRRTVPCTTRKPRPGEISGVDYTFLTVEEFLALEKSGNLLESGLFDGNHYGTPKPPKDPLQPSPFRRTNSMGTLLPGQTPSSEGKRRRNRSNIETGTLSKQLPNQSDIGSRDVFPKQQQRKKSLEHAQSMSHDRLGPLPPNWEMAFTEDGTPYFIDHTSAVTHWLDPRLARNQKKSLLDCDGNELPYGWEKVEDPHYGTYYIDHVNRKTQYQNPVIEAKKVAEKEGGDSTGSGSLTRQDSRAGRMNGKESPPSYGSHKPYFTRNPEELKGEFIKTKIGKSPRGFGFTIVGGDDTDEEFLQIKNVVAQGPAYLNGVLQTGDVLVYINDHCVLGYTHQDVVSMFQAMPIGDVVTLEVCRGYTLPFDPNDPNTEIITTVAVTLPPYTASTNTVTRSRNIFLTDAAAADRARNNKSLPDLSGHSNNAGDPATLRNRSFDDVRNHNNVDGHDDDDMADSSPPGGASHNVELLTMPIVKGAMGFGFTIADSVYGQKVKQILDKVRCKTLAEGDILVEINGIKVKDMCHAEVVGVLKGCQKGDEVDIVIQRGGMPPSKGRKPTKNPRVNGITSRSPYPGESPSYNTAKPHMSHEGSPASNDRSPSADLRNDSTPDGDEKSNIGATLARRAQSERISERGGATTRDTEAEFQGHQPPRSKTPTIDSDGHSRVPSADDRARTPVAEYLPDYRRKTPSAGADMNQFDARFQPSPGMYVGGSYEDYRRGQHPGYGGDHYQQQLGYGPRGYGPMRRDVMNNRSFNQFDRTDYAVPPRQPMRSRTPGPEFMRRSPDRDDPYFQQGGATDMRSKTPTPGSGDAQYRHHNISGTPDFIPASRYQAPPSAPPNRHNNGAPPLTNHHGNARPLSNPDLVQTYGKDAYGLSMHQTRLPSSQSHTGALSGMAPGGAMHHSPYGNNFVPGRPMSPPVSNLVRKQSTSFEHEEPTPMNLTRVQGHGDPWAVGDSGSDGLNHSRSPALSFDCDDCSIDMTVALRRQESGFGFRIVGGTEEGSQVSIGHIVPNGAADVDGRLLRGDEIVFVDSTCVLGASHHRVVELMAQAGQTGHVTLGIRRRKGGSSLAASPERAHNSFPETQPFEVTVKRRENEGFGFVIISSVTRVGSMIDVSSNDFEYKTSEWFTNRCRPFPWIGRIIDNSPAERCGRLHVGDRIIAVNGINIMNIHHEDIVNLIKDCGYSVTLTVLPQLDDTASPQQGSIMSTKALPSHAEDNSPMRAANYSPFHMADKYQPPSLQPRHTEALRQRGFSPRPVLREAEEDRLYSVELHRGSRGFGFSIRGGKEFNNMPLFVLRVADGGAADVDGRLRVGDQLIEINGFSTHNITHTEAIDLIQNGGATVRLKVKRSAKMHPHLVPGSQPGRAMKSLPNGPVGQSSPNMGADMGMPDNYFHTYHQQGMTNGPHGY